MCSKVDAFCKEYFFSSIKPQADIHMCMCMCIFIYMKQNLLWETTKLMTRCEVFVKILLSINLGNNYITLCMEIRTLNHSYCLQTQEFDVCG